MSGSDNFWKALGVEEKRSKQLREMVGDIGTDAIKNKLDMSETVRRIEALEATELEKLGAMCKLSQGLTIYFGMSKTPPKVTILQNKDGMAVKFEPMEGDDTCDKTKSSKKF